MNATDGHKPLPVRWIKDILIGVLTISGGIYLLIAIGSSSTSTPPPQHSPGQSDSSISVGSEARLSRGGPNVPVAIDEEVLPDLIRAAAAHDLTAISSLHGRIFLVPDETRARIVESSVNASRVRILSGSQKGRLGWVPVHWLKQSN
jgi:hypothetical protein